MAVEVKKVKTRRDMKAFVKLPFSLYRGNTCWVPPLVSDVYRTLHRDKNPVFEYAEAEYWLACKDGKPAGRIVGIINPKVEEKWGTKYARFGWIEFIEDIEVAAALLHTVEAWAAERGMEAIQGPMGFIDTDPEGMLVEGFDELGTLPMIYNHPYYPRFMEQLGYVKDVDWLEFEVTCPPAIPEKVLRVNDLVLKRSKLRIAELKNRKELVNKYGRQFFEVIDDAYSELYGTVPITEKQIDLLIKQYLGFVSLPFAKLVVDENDRLAALGIAMPSLSRALQKARGHMFPFGWYHLLKALKNPKTIDLYLIATRKEYQGRGLNALLMTEINREAIERGVVSAETSGELEDNIQVQQLWRYYESRQHKRRRAYIKRLKNE
jgi:GNAT superfamily N-acetyltransferase